MKKLLSILVSAILLLSMCGAIGCAGADDVDPQTLQIKAFKGGYGVEWLYDIAEKFTEETGNKVAIKKVYSANDIRTELQSGVSKTDLFFTMDFLYNTVGGAGVTIDGKRYDSYYADITDVWNSNAYGDTKTIKSKINDMYSQWFCYEDKYYAMPWASGYQSLVYNADILEANNWDVPVTTDEFIDLCRKINTAKLKNIYGKTVYPITISEESSEGDYSYEFFFAWFAQYNGYEGWNRFWDGYDVNGNRYQKTIIANTGILRSLEVMEDLLSPDNGFIHKNAGTDTFTDSQFRFLEKETVFAPNGDWMISEMSEDYEPEEVANVKMCFMPVLSSITETFTGEDANMDDKVLASIVREVDAGKTSSESCSQATFDRIVEARHIVGTNGNLHIAVVPSYSKKIEMAKEFLKYLYSNYGIESFCNRTYGCTLPTKDYDYTTLDIFKNNTFQLSMAQMKLDDKTIFQYNHKNVLFSKNGLYIMNGIYQEFTPKLYASNSKDRMSAEDLYNKNIQYVNQRWSTNYGKGL